MKDGKKLDESAYIANLAYSPDGKSFSYTKKDVRMSDRGPMWDEVVVKDGKEFVRYPYVGSESTSRPAIRFLSYSPNGKNLDFVVTKETSLSCIGGSFGRDDVFVENGVEQHLRDTEQHCV